MKYLITFIIVLFCSIVEASPAPDWVLGRGHPNYDPAQYLMGVGHSDKSSTSASESARAELIKSISIKISSTLNDYDSTENSYSESSLHTSTDFLLEGSQVKDGWYDEEKDVYYSLVVIKRQYVLDTLLNIIDLIFEKNLLKLKQGDDFYSNDDAVKALVYYYDGYVDSLKLFPYIQTYNSVILNKDKRLLDKKYVLNLIFKDKISKIVDNVEIKSVNKSIQDGVLDFGVKVLLNKRPVSGFPIRFYSVNKHFVETANCQSSGCFINVKVKDVARKNRIHLRAIVDLKILSRYFAYDLDDYFFKRIELVAVNFRAQLQELVAENPPYVLGANQRDSYEFQKRKHKAFRQLQDNALMMGRPRWGINDIGPLGSNPRVRWNIGVRSPNLDIRIGN